MGAAICPTAEPGIASRSNLDSSGQDANAHLKTHMQGRCQALASSPPQTRSATDSCGIEDSALDSAEASGTCTVPGMLLERKLEPHTLAIGAHPKHRSRDAPWAFVFRVRARTLAGVVVAVQSSREIARLARVGRRPALRLENIAAESRTAERVCVMCCIYLGHGRVAEEGCQWVIQNS